MNHQEISLGEGDKLQIQWEKGFKSLEIFQNQQPIAQYSDVAALKLGHQLVLADGRKLTVILDSQGLAIWQGNVNRMSGLKSGVVDMFARAVNHSFGLGGIQTGLGVLFHALGFAINGTNLLGIFNIISGAIIVALGIWAKKTETTLPLYIAFVCASLLCLLSITSFFAIFFGYLAYTCYKGAKQGPLSKMHDQPVFTENGPLDAIL